MLQYQSVFFFRTRKETHDDTLSLWFAPILWGILKHVYFNIRQFLAFILRSKVNYKKYNFYDRMLKKCNIVTLHSYVIL